MTNFTSAVEKSVIVGAEAAFGTIAPANSGKLKTRVSLELNLTRDTYQSARIDSSAQVTGMRSGINKIEGSFSDEVSCGEHAEFYAALLRGEWTTGGSTTSSAIGINGTTGVVTRGSGSWITDGHKNGDVVTISGATTAGNNINVIISDLAALTFKATPVNDAATLTTEAAGATITIALAGKKLIIPIALDDRTDKSFTFEQVYPSLSISDRFTGCKIESASFDYKPSAMSTVEFSVLGKAKASESTQYFTSPASATTTSPLSGADGKLFTNGSMLGVATSLTADINGNLEAAECIGSRDAAAIFLGRIEIEGEVVTYFTDSVLADKFLNEQDVSIVWVQRGDDEDAFIQKFPRVRLGSADVDDADTGGLSQTMSFNAILPDGTDNTWERSSIVFQDTTL